MHWSSDFIGLPWRVRGRTREGVDCYGLCWLAWRAAGFDPPSYADAYPDDREKTESAALIADKRSGWPWQPIAPGEEREFDLLTFRVAGFVSHAALVAGQGRMLHIPEGRESCLEKYRDSRWADRLDGIYRLTS